MFSRTFWERVRDYANKQCKEIYMKEHSSDLKCSRCNTWASEMNGLAYSFIDEEIDRYYTTCKKCGHVSRWIDLGICLSLDN